MEMASERKPSVVHVTSVHGPLDVRIFHKQCRSLAAAGNHVSLVAVGVGGSEVIDGVHVFQIAPIGGRVARIGLSSVRVVCKAVRLKPDVIQFHDPELLPHAIICSLFGYKVIFDFHEDFEKKLFERTWLPAALRRGAVIAFRVLQKIGGALFKAKLAATPAIAGRHAGRRVQVIANYPLREIVDAPGRNLEESSASGPCNRLIYTGGWTANRGVHQVVEALPLVTVPGVRLTVIGQAEQDERERVADLPGFSLVDDKGRVPYEEAVEEMRHSCIGLVCSQFGHGYDQAFPNKLFEYMALGLPVIASCFPLWRELLDHEECVVFVDPSSPEQIAEAIDYLASDGNLRWRMGNNGRDAVQRRFSWQAEARTLVHLYREVLSCV